MKQTITIIAIIFATLQIQAQSKVKIGGNIGYHLGAGGVKSSASPFLFFKNGQSAGVDFTIVPPKGTTRFKLAVDYIAGTNDEKSLITYAKDNDITYTSYKLTKAKPSGFSVMASPKLCYFQNLKIKNYP